MAHFSKIFRQFSKLPKTFWEIKIVMESVEESNLCEQSKVMSSNLGSQLPGSSIF